MDFKRLTIEDLDIISPYLKTNPRRMCDFTPGTAVMWREFFSTEYCIFKDTLVFRVDHFGRPAYSIPLGEGSVAVISELICDEGEILLINASEDDISLLNSRFCASEISSDKAWQDYLYTADSFKTYSGKKLSGQRNHVNRFKRLYPDAHVEIICEDNIKNVLALHRRLSENTKSGDTREVEQKIVCEVLERYSEYRQLGICLFVGDTPVAFEIGETVGDTLYAHIEKADIAYSGAYQVIASEFARHFAHEGILYLNREEDTGDEGLRKSKLSYQPCAFVEKFSVKLKKED